jgi:hypothetical protein
LSLYRAGDAVRRGGGKGLSKRAKAQSQLSVSTGAFDQTPSIIATDLADESRVEARNRFRFLNAE